MDCFTLVCQIPSHLEDQVSALLESLEALSITLTNASEQALHEPLPGQTPLWDQLQLQALFSNTQDSQQVIEQLRQQVGPDCTIDIKPVIPQAQQTQTLHEPIDCGQHLWICPHNQQLPDTHAKAVFLEPGLGFGTGQHATTFLCLQWLAKHPPHNQVVIDYGCGSGILALAACRLGADTVLAVDYDEQALLASQENRERNQLPPEQLQVMAPEAMPNQLQADLIMANILANPLIELAASFKKWLKPHGQLILSGILSEQVERVCEAYAEHVELEYVDERDGWCLLYMRDGGPHTNT